MHFRATGEGSFAVLAVLVMHIDKERWERRTNCRVGGHHPAANQVGLGRDTLLPSGIL